MKQKLTSEVISNTVVESKYLKYHLRFFTEIWDLSHKF